MGENVIIVRKQFVYLLNFALDLSKKDFIEADELVGFSNETKNFIKWLDKIDFAEEVKKHLKKVNFHYPPWRKDFADSFYLIFRHTFVNSIQQIHRRMLLNDFLKKHDKLLKLLN